MVWQRLNKIKVKTENRGNGFFWPPLRKCDRNVGSYYFCGWRPARVKEAINENIFWLQWAFSRLYAKISCNAMVILHFKIFFFHQTFISPHSWRPESQRSWVWKKTFLFWIVKSLPFLYLSLFHSSTHEYKRTLKP